MKQLAFHVAGCSATGSIFLFKRNAGKPPKVDGVLATLSQNLLAFRNQFIGTKEKLMASPPSTLPAADFWQGDPCVPQHVVQASEYHISVQELQSMWVP